MLIECACVCLTFALAATCTHVVAIESIERTRKRDDDEVRAFLAVSYGSFVHMISDSQKQLVIPTSIAASTARKVNLTMFFVWQNDLLLSLFSCTMVTNTRARAPRKNARLIAHPAAMNANKGLLFRLSQTSRGLVVLLACAGNRHGWSNRPSGPPVPVRDLQLL